MWFVNVTINVRWLTPHILVWWWCWPASLVSVVLGWAGGSRGPWPGRHFVRSAAQPSHCCPAQPAPARSITTDVRGHAIKIKWTSDRDLILYPAESQGSWDGVEAGEWMNLRSNVTWCDLWRQLCCGCDGPRQTHFCWSMVDWQTESSRQTFRRRKLSMMDA